MNELIARASGQFSPKSSTDFIGENIIQRSTGTDRTGAARVARSVERAVKLANQNERMPLKFLFNGGPGIGKSTLVQFLQFITLCNKWNTTKLNGTECKIDKIEEIARSLNYANLFGDWRMLWIDEADEIPRLAQVRLLTMLDDLPLGVIVACTSNCRLEDFEKRFQSRFQCFEIAQPEPTEIEKLITRVAPTLARQVAAQIANFACGNVRQAMLDTLGAIQQFA